ncbi:MAG TPA: 16S rRNA (uracil(1498)-N(3))-methyltransferase [Bacteroidales bacterium]|jgi:16S rRNA (uracil1498-N3)-methyltransferase|nr:16S rRNA (uracil(1498)-N(3))-methyltransferase [Bacteroidales bacterium]HOL98214.1 16S rRNA (uracil(1498)-N(3))-methyltransferase [Bacteroidales bacterium]HOM36437.1 16S rRNA (uracil(1498)-N(3))-methyltransferase [Bacteroidales bacterium]HPD23889.1 16S rRNA (uracil(1498)-N(3))-methyltransferase [Bacteroidales bacterium]HRS99960.1 16S rRNA (uracil(1498)-N(3))-methyltransferase [Bacteroidales bacterium]
MHLFYDPEISFPFHKFNEDESKHISRVLRMQVGDHIWLTDGKGNMHKSTISNITGKIVEVRIIETYKDYEKRNYYLHIAIAPTKNIDRYEWFVEKSTEIGIDEITPIICKNSERKIVKTDRLKRIAESAMKQSYKAYHPVIDEQLNFEKFITQYFGEAQKFIAHCEEHNDKIYLGNLLKKEGSYLILIGPEGDFNAAEIQMAKDTGFIPVSLGRSRLRTETAGVVACDIISVINQL